MVEYPSSYRFLQSQVAGPGRKETMNLESACTTAFFMYEIRASLDDVKISYKTRKRRKKGDAAECSGSRKRHGTPR
ncbi:hypothetical protein M404DRAFT_995703 [Pisolithus tinctorius Marx 270]|uniref:Uncharacterized protein n=1 Tax=Pisolithus tinctorius Marx 270 TaxID=870435 RepID=A0A0C3PPV2_PISTI|nr:hypothetical protein M404DRAFT_995703 [Pisolithus tinctorius Marx 270]